MKNSNVLYAFLMMSSVLTGCSSNIKNKMCFQFVPQAKQAIAAQETALQNAAVDAKLKLVPELEQLKDSLEFAKLPKLADKLEDPRFLKLYKALANEEDPRKLDLTRIKALGGAISKDYCPAPRPPAPPAPRVVVVQDYFNACIESITKLTFGVNESNTSACKKVNTEAAADCVATFVGFDRFGSIDEDVILACAKLTTSGQSDCVKSLSRLTFGLDENKILACKKIESSSEAHCVDQIVSATRFSSIDEDQILSCSFSR